VTIAWSCEKWQPIENPLGTFGPPPHPLGLMDLEMPDFWPSQPGDFKNQHLLPWQQVSKNHIIDGPPCTFFSTEPD
jgi:hypothetical protein